MKMPTSEIIDRYTITLLKSERTDEDVSEELEAYKKELPKKHRRKNKSIKKRKSQVYISTSSSIKCIVR